MLQRSLKLFKKWCYS